MRMLMRLASVKSTILNPFLFIFLLEVDYKTMVMRQESACKDFETKMIIACERLQDLEDHHLQKMHLFVSKYLDLEEEKDKEIQDVRTRGEK